MKEQRNGENMQFETLISSSGEFYYIDRLDDIIKIAALTKAKMFYVDEQSSMLFGSFEEPYSIIKTMIPFKPTTSLYFSSTMFGNTALKEAINKNRTFFYVPEYPWIIFSENRRASLMNGRIKFNHENLEFRDTFTNERITDCLITYYPEDMFIMNAFKQNFLKWNASANWYMSNPAIIFENMQNANEIQYLIQNKVTAGSIIMNLNTEDRQFTFYVFKALVGSMTKQDTLTINIYPDPYLSNSIMIEFIIHKHKLKTGINDYHETTIHTFVRMINLFHKATD